jgi:DEAD/DEAH box helicase domain-containing protein
LAQGKCLIDESEALGIEAREPPPGVSWPETFPSVFNLAKPGVRRPREFDFIAQLGANSPHFNYPLRQVGEPNYKAIFTLRKHRLLDGGERFRHA